MCSHKIQTIEEFFEHLNKLNTAERRTELERFLRDNRLYWNEYKTFMKDEDLYLLEKLNHLSDSWTLATKKPFLSFIDDVEEDPKGNKHVAFYAPIEDTNVTYPTWIMDMVKIPPFDTVQKDELTTKFGDVINLIKNINVGDYGELEKMLSYLDKLKDTAMNHVTDERQKIYVKLTKNISKMPDKAGSLFNKLETSSLQTIRMISNYIETSKNFLRKKSGILNSSQLQRHMEYSYRYLVITHDRLANAIIDDFKGAEKKFALQLVDLNEVMLRIKRMGINIDA